MAAGIIWDVVGSRTRDRAELREAIRAVIARVHRLPGWVVPPQPTVGDEVQALAEDARTAIQATLLVRVHLAADAAAVEVRAGVGVGEVHEVEGLVFGDGPGWWAAREALEEAARAERAPRRPRGPATRVRWATGPGEPWLVAYLVLRDDLLSDMRPRDHRLLAGLLDGASLADLAAQEAVTHQAVSARLARSGAYAVAAGPRGWALPGEGT